MKLSQWHSGSVKPVHVGVYEREDKKLIGIFSHWTGRYWTLGFSDNNKYMLKASKTGRSYSQDLAWRGIVKDKK